MFEKLALKDMKGIIRQYKLTTQIKMTKVVEGKRKSLTKKELSDEMHKHLEIGEDGEITMKEHKFGMFKQSEKRTRTVKPKPVAEKSQPILEPGFEFIKGLQKEGKKKRKIDYSAGHYNIPLMTILFYEKYGLKCPMKSIEMDTSKQTWDMDKFIKSFKRCLELGEKIICVPLISTGHANLLIFKVDTREIIRYEPHGATTNAGEYNFEEETFEAQKTFNKGCRALTKGINIALSLLKKGMRPFMYIPPAEICPKMPNSEEFKMGFQALENTVSDLPPASGFCQAWSMFFMECILRNPDMDIKDVYKNAHDAMNGDPKYMFEVIKGYYKKTNELLKDIGFHIKTYKDKPTDKIPPGEFYEKFYAYLKKVNKENEKLPKKKFTGKGTFNLPVAYKGKGAFNLPIPYK